MGIVLTVLEPPHHPESNLIAALPPGTGRVIDVEPRLVSPRYDTLLVTSRGLVVRDHGTGDFHGVPWTNFSLDDHLRQHSRHAVLTLWLNGRRPLELAITRRLALNIESVAPVLRLHPSVVIDDIVVTDHDTVIDMRDAVSGYQRRASPINRGNEVPRIVRSFPGVERAGEQTLVSSLDLRSPPYPLKITNGHQPTTGSEASRLGRFAVGATMLVVAGLFGGVLSMAVNSDDSPADGSIRMITSEAVALD